MTVTAGDADGVTSGERTDGRGTDQRWIVSRGFALSLAHLSGALALIVLTPRLLSALGPVQFGAWVSLSAAAAVAGLLDPGLTSAPGRLISRALADGRRSRVVELVSTGLVAQAVQGLALFVVGALTAGALAGLVAPGAASGPTAAALRLAIAAVAISGLQTALDGTLVGLRRLSTLAVVRTCRSIALVVATLAVADQGLIAVFWAQVGANACGVLLAGIAARRAFGAPLLVRRALARHALAELVRYGAPRQMSWVLGVLARRSGPLAVAVGSGSVAAGQAGVGFLAVSGAAGVFAVAGTPLTPVLTESAAGTAREHFDRRAARSLVAATTAACAMFGALAVGAPALVAAWTGHELGGAVTALRWLAPGFAAWSIAGIASIAGQALGRPRLEGEAALVGGAAVVSATAVGAATAGVAGAAAGTSLGLVAASLWYLRLLRDPWPALPLRSIAITACLTAAGATLVALLPWPHPGHRLGDLILATAQVAAFVVTFAGVRWSTVAISRARRLP